MGGSSLPSPTVDQGVLLHRIPREQVKVKAYSCQNFEFRRVNQGFS
jgi:hypothetical protein